MPTATRRVSLPARPNSLGRATPVRWISWARSTFSRLIRALRYVVGVPGFSERLTRPTSDSADEVPSAIRPAVFATPDLTSLATRSGSTAGFFVGGGAGGGRGLGRTRVISVLSTIAGVRKRRPLPSAWRFRSIGPVLG